MSQSDKHRNELFENGFSIIENVYSALDIENILSEIQKADTTKETFRISTDLFAVRQFLNEIPAVVNFIFTDTLKSLLRKIINSNFFVVKSIYFDKPANSNWYVSYHQDLTISVDKKIELDNFGSWTIKQNQFAVQPPIAYLENITTIRIHLDDTDENNGALKIIPNSHLKKIYRPETIDWTNEKEVSCNVHRGGIMLMKPLILHSSGRTNNQKQRRVIHIEVSDMELPASLQWAERINLD